MPGCKEVRGKVSPENVVLFLSGRIDSGNSQDVRAAMQEVLAGAGGLPVVIDAEALEYISSAGLRVLLQIRKAHPELVIRGVNSEVYEILDMTGFTQMMKVEKAYRRVSIEGCEVIGQGANGTVYRIDSDNVVKVYNNPDALAEIQHEREVARTALVLGIPTAISYDVVRVGKSYGSVFELLNARSFAKILATEPERIDWCVKEYIDLLKKIHGTVVPKGQLPDIREQVISWAEFMQDYLPEEPAKKLLRMIQDVPPDDHMIHGDYHTKNVELTGDEVLLIDMDTLAVGHPVFEWGSMFNAFLGFSEYDKGMILRFQGFPHEVAEAFWKKILVAYVGTEDEKKLKEVEDKARIVGYTRLIRRSIRRGGLNDPDKKAEIDMWTGELLELLETTDSLLFLRNEWTGEAVKENLPGVLSFVEERLAEAGCPARLQMKITMAVEEIITNVIQYAYTPGTGPVTLRMDIKGEPDQAVFTVIDRGTPYNPLIKKDPDVTLSAAERQIGGLGIYLVKQTMDDISYEYKDGRNILTMKKALV